jgi:hypothetical protein
MSQLPVLYAAQLVERPNTVVTVLNCSIWPATQRINSAGVAYDHEGEAPLEHADALAVANRVLRWDGNDYMIVEATPHPLLPHVALRLRRVESSRSG